MCTVCHSESAQWLHASLHCTANEYLKKLTEMEGFKEFQTSDFEVELTNLCLIPDVVDVLSLSGHLLQITVSKVELHADPIG